jgi:hypothetical protein
MIPTFAPQQAPTATRRFERRAIIVAEKSSVLLASRIEIISLVRSGRSIASTIVTRR